MKFLRLVELPWIGIRKLGDKSMNAVETILLNFAKNELKNNPQFAVNLVNHLIQQKVNNPQLITDIDAVLIEILPQLIGMIKF